MKKILQFLMLTMVLAGCSEAADQAPTTAPPSGYCSVQICNKLERFTLSPWSMIKDKMGETCSNTILLKSDAVVDKEFSSDTRMLQGSFNPTKKSVTRVKQVYSCTK